MYLYIGKYRIILLQVYQIKDENICLYKKKIIIILYKIYVYQIKS